MHYSRSASYEAIATALERLRLRTWGRIGMRIARSPAVSIMLRGRPWDSLPKTSTSPRVRPASVCSRVAVLVKNHGRVSGIVWDSFADQVVPVVDHLPFQVLPVIEPGSLEIVVVGPKSERSDEPQFGGDRNAGSTHTAGVVGDLWLVEHDM